MTIRYVGTDANAHEYNSGITSGAAYVSTGNCTLTDNADNTFDVLMGTYPSGWSYAPGDEVSVITSGGTWIGCFAITGITDEGAMALHCTGSPGSLSDVTVRINGLATLFGMWNYNNLSQPAGGHIGAQAGDDVRIYSASTITCDDVNVRVGGEKGNPIRFRGCNSAWSPLLTGYVGLANSTGASTVIANNTLYHEWGGLQFSNNNSSGSTFGLYAANYEVIRRCKFVGGNYALRGSRAMILDSVFETTGDYCCYLADGPNVFVGNYCKGAGVAGVRFTKGGACRRNRLYDCANNIELYATEYPADVSNNSIDGGGGAGSGILVSDGTADALIHVANNIIANISGYGIAGSWSSGYARLLAETNAFHDCSSGNVQGVFTGDTDGGSIGPLTTDPFTDPSNGDFSLVSGIECLGAGTPDNLDLGALQAAASGGGGLILNPGMTGGLVV